MASATLDSAMISFNPATGQPLGSVATTTPEAIASIVERSREAQAAWALTSYRERSAVLDSWRIALARDLDEWIVAICNEVGKPSDEALTELVSTLDAIRWTARHGRSALADQRIGPGHQRFMLIGPSTLRWRPIGVVGMIGTWNYPLLLNAPTIAQALFAGNGLVWKPSELAPLLGQKLHSSLGDAGLPEGLVATVQGGGNVGEALMRSEIDIGHFTGGIENGRRILGELGHRGLPSVAELAGFDAAIVLPDAPLDSTGAALAWGAFVGAGQTCVAVKRVYVVGDPEPWAEAVATRTRALRIGDPSSRDVDLGPMISEPARDRFDSLIHAALSSGGRLVTGGKAIEGPGWFYAPTVLLADRPEPEQELAGCFGPVVMIRGVATTDEAVKTANSSRYGLTASVWSRDHREARRIADRLEVGMVAINDAVTPSAHAGSPFGGVKSSGHGRSRGALGLREFAQPQTLQTRGTGGFRPQLFPYARRLGALMRGYIQLFHRR